MVPDLLPCRSGTPSAPRSHGIKGSLSVGDIDVLVLGIPGRDRLYESVHDLERRLGRGVQVTIRDADWLTAGKGDFHDTIADRPLIEIPLPPTTP